MLDVPTEASQLLSGGWESHAVPRRCGCHRMYPVLRMQTCRMKSWILALCFGDLSNNRADHKRTVVSTGVGGASACDHFSVPQQNFPIQRPDGSKRSVQRSRKDGRRGDKDRCRFLQCVCENGDAARRHRPPYKGFKCLQAPPAPRHAAESHFLGKTSCCSTFEAESFSKYRFRTG